MDNFVEKTHRRAPANARLLDSDVIMTKPRAKMLEKSTGYEWKLAGLRMPVLHCTSPAVLWMKSDAGAPRDGGGQ